MFQVHQTIKKNKKKKSSALTSEETDLLADENRSEENIKSPIDFLSYEVSKLSGFVRVFYSIAEAEENS